MIDDNWIQTYTGKKFWPLNPKAEDICIEDIAHALSMKCRFGGHCKRFYSVAQHSVLVSQNCKDDRWGLMHDAAEAYMPDVASPIKHRFPLIQTMEYKLLDVIAEKFGLINLIPQDVHAADLVLLATEQRDLMADRIEWGSLYRVRPLVEEIAVVGCYGSKFDFLVRFRQLFGDGWWNQ